jgi:sugar transferase (PEP-CTERM/EpsH1 system associated)
LKILVALSRFPLPTDKGDKLRAWNQLQGLAEQHDVYLFCTSDEPVSADNLSKLKLVCKQVEVFQLSKVSIGIRLLKNVIGELPYQVAWFSHPQAISQFQKFASRIKPDVLFCQLARMAEFAKYTDSALKILDYQDAFSKGLERRLDHEPWWKRIFIESEYIRLKNYERMIFSRFDLKLIISKQDALLIEHPEKEELIVLSNGVDTEHFKPLPAAKTIDLLFTGNMSYEPNVNCVKYVVEEVLPLLKPEFPHIQFVVAGKNPSRELERLHSKNLQLTGWIDDLRQYYQQARLFVAPMKIGIGMQNKILEAMAMGIPVITSSLANNAIGAVHGKEIWIADTPQKVADAIYYLLNNTELSIKIGQAARQFMNEKFTWKKQNEQLNRLLNQSTKVYEEV